MVILGIENEQQLVEWEKRLTTNFSTFIEPDRNNEKTSIAISPAADPKLFKNLRLL